MVKYLPAYAPALNLIEILWRFMKYYWLPFSAYTSFQCLSAAVERDSHTYWHGLYDQFSSSVEYAKHCVHLLSTTTRL